MFKQPHNPDDFACCPIYGDAFAVVGPLFVILIFGIWYCSFDIPVLRVYAGAVFLSGTEEKRADRFTMCRLLYPFSRCHGIPSSCAIPVLGRG